MSFKIPGLVEVLCLCFCDFVIIYILESLSHLVRLHSYVTTTTMCTYAILIGIHACTILFESEGDENKRAVAVDEFLPYMHELENNHTSAMHRLRQFTRLVCGGYLWIAGRHLAYPTHVCNVVV